jgi:hypothetical protein
MGGETKTQSMMLHLDFNPGGNLAAVIRLDHRHYFPDRSAGRIRPAEADFLNALALVPNCAKLFVWRSRLHGNATKFPLFGC